MKKELMILNYLTGDGQTIELVSVVGRKFRFTYDGFDFTCDKYKFPPKKVVTRLADDKVAYAIHLAKNRHGDKYDYSKVKGNSKHQIITCRSCVYEFKQNFSNHIQGNGCPKCADLSRNETQRFDKSKFVQRSVDVYGDRFNYDKVVYSNIDSKVEIKCNICDTEFYQTPYNHIKVKHPCPTCRVKALKGVKVKPTNKFIEQANDRWGSSFDYSLVEYVGSHNKVKIKCNTCEGIFEQSPTNHLSDKGCPICSKGFCVYSRSSYDALCKDGSSLYVMKLSNEQETFYKIGISKNVESRVRQVCRSSGYTVSLEYQFDSSGGHVFDLEKLLHREFRENKYSPNTKFQGYNECFVNVNIVEVDKLCKCVA